MEKNLTQILKEMFGNLFNFKYTRTKHEVIGFYLVYTLITILLGALASGILSMFITAETFEEIQNLIMILVPTLSVIFIGSLSVFIMMSKKIYKETGVIIIFIITILTTFFLGAIIGCAPFTLLTTYENKNI